MKIFLLRHGEVENPNDVLYGRLPNFHLSEEGRDHVRRTAQQLKTSNIKKVYSSPMERTIETSQILIESLGLDKADLIVDSRLIESDCRDWQGKPLEEFREMVKSTDWTDQVEIEPMRESGARVQQVLQEIAQKGENAVVVSHGDPLTGALVNILDDFDFYNNHYMKKAEFAELSYNDGKFTLKKLSH